MFRIGLAVLFVVSACHKGKDTGNDKDTDNGTSPAPAQASRLEVAVDPRVELMSIAFRHAGLPRYTEASTPYAQAVDKAFDPEPLLFALTRQLGTRHPIGYEMAPTLAIHFDRQWQPVRPLEPLPPTLSRWKIAKLDTYLGAVRQLARSPELARLFDSQRDYFARVEAADRKWIAGVPLIDWFDRVFGARPHTRYHLVPGLLNGPMDYAAHVDLPDGGQDVYVIAHLDHPDEHGVPSPTPAALGFAVHELCHTYTNPIVDKALEDLIPIAAPAIAKVKDAMHRQAYSTDAVVIEESVVRAVVVLWQRDRNGAAAGDAEVATQERLGFAWIRPLVDALDKARQRDGALSAAAVVEATRSAFDNA